MSILLVVALAMTCGACSDAASHPSHLANLPNEVPAAVIPPISGRGARTITFEFPGRVLGLAVTCLGEGQVTASVFGTSAALTGQCVKSGDHDSSLVASARGLELTPGHHTLVVRPVKASTTWRVGVYDSAYPTPGFPAM